jgi:hypothetical protein
MQDRARPRFIPGIAFGGEKIVGAAEPILPALSSSNRSSAFTLHFVRLKGRFGSRLCETWVNFELGVVRPLRITKESPTARSERPTFVRSHHCRVFTRPRSPTAVQGIEKTSIQCPCLPDSGSQTQIGGLLSPKFVVRCEAPRSLSPHCF